MHISTKKVKLIHFEMNDSKIKNFCEICFQENKNKNCLIHFCGKWYNNCLLNIKNL